MAHKWKDIKKKFVKIDGPTIEQELWSIKSGESAFKIRVPFYNNPYKDKKLNAGWIRGWKRAERAFNEGLKLSARIQESIGFEEVEA
jgi:hypothetical protein